MRAIVVGFAVALAVMAAGCFPDPPQKDGDDASDTGGGLDTSIAGDTEPQGDADATAPEDTADTALADAADAEDTATDTLVADTTDTADAVDGDTTPPECTSPAECQHLAGTCVKVLCLAGSCAAQPDTGNACDDGQACTKGDTCQGFSCVGAAYACDDGVSCTDDVCTGDGGCSYPAREGFCHIGGACVVAGKVKVDDPCRVCVAGDAWSPNDGASCEDGDPVCTLGDTCEGTECVGGAPPDDSAGDWAMNVVESSEPAQAGVRAVHAIGASSWLFVAQASGGGSVALQGDSIPLRDRSVVAVTRPTVGAEQLAGLWTGFQAANLEASASRGGYVLAVRLSGPGTVTLGGEPVSLESEPSNTTYLAGWSVLGGLAFHHKVEHEVDALSVSTDAGFVAVETVGPIVQLPSLGYDHTGVSSESNTVVIKYSSLGLSQWLVRVSTHDYRPLSATTCTSSADTVVVASFRGAAEIETPSGHASITTSPGAVGVAVLRIDPDGAIVSSSVPFTYGGEPATSLDLPSVACDADGIVLAFRNRSPDSSSVLQLGRSSLVRVAWSGVPDWILSTSAQSLALTTFGSELIVSGSTIVGASEPPTIDLKEEDGTTIAVGDSGEAVALFTLSQGGGLQWFASYPAQRGPGIVSIAARGEATAVGGVFVGAAAVAHPDGRMPLTGNAAINAFGALLNTRGELGCTH
ncbi:MAG: hypothetical protein H6745_17120 [Deltaproteobacteria bacterium]|nr:hypothetical protein [Deltaproteobacteria bacterium]